MSSPINHEALAISRLATEFRESINLINYIKTLLIEADDLEGVIQDTITERFLDNAAGINLDIIGEIVGQSREFIDAEIFSYFGFFDHPLAQSFGTLTDPGIGGRWRFLGEPIQGTRLLTDEEYRQVIRARIIRNSTHSTPEDIIFSLQFLFEVPQILFKDGDTEYTISISRRLSLNEKSVLLNTNLVPKTVGVHVNYIIEYDYDNFFGFIGIPNAKGFGSINNASLGGRFGNLITN